MSSRIFRPAPHLFQSFTPAIPPDWQVLHRMPPQQQDSIKSIWLISPWVLCWVLGGVPRLRIMG